MKSTANELHYFIGGFITAGLLSVLLPDGVSDFLRWGISLVVMLAVIIFFRFLKNAFLGKI